MTQKAVRKSKAGEAAVLPKETQAAPTCEAQVEVTVKDFEEETADDFLAEMIPIVRAWMRRLMNESKDPPKPDANAPKYDMMTRSREAAASSTIVKTLQDLDALARAREKRGKKNSTLDERQLMEKFIRRLDELLSRGTPPSAFKPSAQRKPDGG